MTLSRSSSDPLWVVVVRSAAGNVIAVLGPTNDETEATAISQVLRRSRGELVSVHQIRPHNMRDLHGEGFDA